MAGDDATVARATVKDVYEITGRVEAKLDVLASLVSSYTVANEHRFTKLETDGRATETRLSAVEGEVDELRTAHAVARSHMRVVVWSAAGLLTLFAGVGGVAATHALHW